MFDAGDIVICNGKYKGMVMDSHGYGWYTVEFWDGERLVEKGVDSEDLSLVEMDDDAARRWRESVMQQDAANRELRETQAADSEIRQQVDAETEATGHDLPQEAD
jgi:hypothetical protein